MATVQMPDGALVELPDDADEQLKEQIRQKVEALRQNQPQPQGGSPTPMPSVAPVERTGETGFVFAPTSGAQADLSEARQFAAEPERPGIAIPRIPQQESLPARPGAVVPEGVIIPRSGAQMESLGAREFAQDIPQTGAALANVGAGVVEGIETPQSIGLLPVLPFKPLQAALGAVMAKGAIEQGAQAFDPDKTMQERFEAGGGAAATALMAALALKEPIAATRTGLRSAFDPLFAKHEPISPTPLSDAATKEVSDASKVTSTEGIPSEQIRPSVDEETPLRQPGETPEVLPLEEGQPVAAPGGGAGSAEGNVGLPADVAQSPQGEVAAPNYLTEDHPLASQLEQISGPDTAFNQREAQQLFDQGHAIYSTLPDGKEAVKVKSIADISKYDPSSLAVLRRPIPATEAATTAPKLLPGELQGDLLSSTQSEPLKLVGETVVDHEARALEEQGKAEARAKSEENQTTFEDLGNVRDIPEDATVRVKLKNTAGEPIEIPMNAREAEGIFRKERSSYDALIDCLSR